MSEARTQYEAACKRAKLAERTVIERQRMLELLSNSVVKVKGFNSGWHANQASHTREQLRQLAEK